MAARYRSGERGVGILKQGKGTQLLSRIAAGNKAKTEINNRVGGGVLELQIAVTEYRRTS